MPFHQHQTPAARILFVLVLAACAVTPRANAQDSAPTPESVAGASATPGAPLTSGINLESIDYPFAIEHFVPDPARPQDVMAYMTVAESDWTRGTVLLLHGKNFNGDYWGPTARDLVAEGYRVVIPDQIGWGKSSKPIDVPYSFHRMARQTAALLDHLGVEKPLVMGHSMGGMLATRFALSFPERTVALVLLNPIGLEDWQALTPYRTVEQWEKRELGKTREGIKAYMRASYYDGNWDPKYDRGVDLLAAPSPAPTTPAWPVSRPGNTT